MIKQQTESWEILYIIEDHTEPKYLGYNATRK